jgi:periplasmic protein TonB
MSDLGNLSQCMVDSDAAAKTRARKLRRKALAASVALEAVAVAGVMLWPLVTLGVLPVQVVVTPLPPFHGAREPQQQATNPPHTIRSHASIHRDIFRQPLAIPPRVNTDPDPEPPSIGDGNGPVSNGVPAGLGGGPPPIEIAQLPRPQTRTVMRGAQVMEAMLVHRIEPDYPPIAIAMHLSGTVILRAIIGTNGEMRNLEVESGNQILAEAARRAVLQWRYRPTMLNGQAVEVETQITVHFVLNSD